MPPLLKTYFNPTHRKFLQTLFTATFLGSVAIVAFPCPVRPTTNSSSSSSSTSAFHGIANQSARDDDDNAMRSGRRMDVVVMMNERGKGKRSLFMEED